MIDSLNLWQIFAKIRKTTDKNLDCSLFYSCHLQAKLINITARTGVDNIGNNDWWVTSWVVKSRAIASHVYRAENTQEKKKVIYNISIFWLRVYLFWSAWTAWRQAKATKAKTKSWIKDFILWNDSQNRIIGGFYTLQKDRKGVICRFESHGYKFFCFLHHCHSN